MTDGSAHRNFCGNILWHTRDPAHASSQQFRRLAAGEDRCLLLPLRLDGHLTY
jgi:hypothetical protein